MLTRLFAALFILSLFAAPVFAQEVMTCSSATPCQVQWDPSPDEDVVEYRVLLSRTPLAQQNPVQYNPAQPAAVVTHPITETSVTASLGTLEEGQYYLVVVAVDEAGNISAFSNEATFRYDGPPAPVTIELIRITIP